MKNKQKREPKRGQYFMASIQKHQLHTVEVNREELEVKLKRHRRKVAALVIFILALIAAAVMITYIYYENKTYNSYEIISSIERSDTSASEFAMFQGNLLKYTNDGAVYTDVDGNMIWNQTYEMDTPVYDTCDNYIALYDLNGTQVYILDTVNLQGSIHTTMPIQKVSVAGQGTVAILMESEGTSYLQLYDKTGKNLASGELHVQNSGYPLDLALSANGEKLAISMLDINEGNLKTVIAFYNFGAVGQNSIDKIVGSYSYSDLMIPKIEYLDGDTMVAFGDSRIILFTGAQKPSESKNIEVSEEIKSIFYDKSNFGMVFDGKKTGKKHRLELYNTAGSKQLDIGFDTDYTDIDLLTNHEICIQGEESCEIYNMKGIQKFQYTFQNHLYKILSGKTGITYTIILEGETQKIKLK